MKKYIPLFVGIALMTSCNQELMNTDSFGVTEAGTKVDGLAYGSPLQNMQQLVVPIGSPTLTTGPGNDLQITDLISSGNYIGYFGNNNNWNYSIESNWNFPDNRMSYAYECFYSKMFKSWNEIYRIAKDSDTPSDKEVLAVSNVIKITAWLRATDVFGPIVYAEAGSGNITPMLDSQKKVYESMLADLANAVQVLKKATGTILQKYDLIYNGNPAKWIKFANSLMLRMAVRVHFVDMELAKKYVTLALNPDNGGVMMTVEDEAKIGSSEKMPLLNPMIASVEEYSETRMGATIWAYLLGYSDSRVSKFFAQSGDTYKYIGPASNISKTGNSSWYPGSASKPKIERDSPMYWMRASEVYFLKAEAVLYGLTGGDAKALYEQGVKTSFLEWGVSDAETYLQGTSLPLDVTQDNNPYHWMNYYECIISNGNVSPNWDDLGTETDKNEVEIHLQKIITQKYLALYPNAVEAWTEYRRTGYPYIMRPMDEGVYSRIGADKTTLAPERFKYSSDEYKTNPNVNKVPELLGGEDIGATKLWWVRPNRPIQK